MTTKKTEFIFPKELEHVRHLINNTGGNTVEDLMNRYYNDSNLAGSNLLVFGMAASIESQLTLLKALYADGYLLPAFPTKLNETALKHVKNLLVSAFEGGSNYWYILQAHNKKMVPESRFVSELLAYEEGTILLSDSDGQLNKPKLLTHSDIIKAWHIFTTNADYSCHYADVLSGNDDAETGDIFLQIAVFGKPIYG